MPVKAVLFDVGETLVDEDHYWREVAALADISPHVLTAALGATIMRGEEHTELWRHLGIERPRAIQDVVYREADLLPEAVPCLTALRSSGYLLGAAGNQTAALENWLQSMGLPLDVIGSSASWGVRKPDPRFFARLVPDGDALFVHAAEGDDDMPAHVRTALTTVSLSVPVADGRLCLGTWQGIYVWEHRRAPHTRSVVVHVIGDQR